MSKAAFLCCLIVATALAAAAQSRFTQPDPIDFNDHEGWTQIFDGKNAEWLGWAA